MDCRYILNTGISCTEIREFILKSENDLQPCDGRRLTRFIREAAFIARPKAVYICADIEYRDKTHVIINGIQFASRVLSVNLSQTRQVFAFVATCGMELEEWAQKAGSLYPENWISLIREQALRCILKMMKRHIDTHHHPGDTSVMNPGSLPYWPLEEQRHLFMLLGDPQDLIGVRLREKGLMIPDRSVSGIRFASREKFVNCQLCPIQDCPIRRCPYDDGLYDRKYRF